MRAQLHGVVACVRCCKTCKRDLQLVIR